MRIRCGTATVKGSVSPQCHWAKAWEDGESDEPEPGYFCCFGNRLNELLGRFQHGGGFAPWLVVPGELFLLPEKEERNGLY